MLGLSLFSGAGIGDIGLRAAGIEFIAFSELEGDRLDLAKSNFSSAKFFVGDIWQTHQEIIQFVRQECERRNDTLGLISCTAPCQGMSKNGQGTLLKNIRDGKRPQLDPRNRLILPALRIIQNLSPELVLFENVLEMRRTIIEDESGKYRNILDIIGDSLGPEYIGDAYDVEFANYGIPQRRQRLITVFSRNSNHRNLFLDGTKLIPDETHSKSGTEGKKPWVSVERAISRFPPLDAKSKDSSVHASVPFHRVPVLDAMKYWWVSSTPVGRTAFDNQCSKCGFQGNPIHSNVRNDAGINQSSKETPLYCLKCEELLPRPSTLEGDGSRRLMAGFTSAYKRMAADLPAPTLTRNFSYACSDQKIHYSQNRVLSIAEALEIHTLSNYEYHWKIARELKPATASDALVRLVIGESIPPQFMELLGRYLLSSRSSDYKPRVRKPKQHALF